MNGRRRASIRLWQTELFIVVIVVAMLILSGSLSAGVETTLARMTETTEIRNASALAQRLQSEFPLDVRGTMKIRSIVMEYRSVYGGGVWVYDTDGTLLESRYDVEPLAAVLESARIRALAEERPSATSDLRPNGWIVAAYPIRGRDGVTHGVVVTASPADAPAAILEAVRDRLWMAFWVSLAVAGLLGFGFSELISRRIRAMSEAASAIEAGDFERRLPVRLVPYEIQDLAESYNSMAARLGEAFASIEESRRQLTAVIESMAEGVLAIGPDATVRIINPEAAHLLGVERRSVHGQPVEAVTDDARVRAVLRSALAGESAVDTVELGHSVVDLHATPLVSSDGSTEGAVLLLADVTERQRIEESQRRFVADASHELRTPIAALKGMLELLVDGAVEKPAVRDEFLATMQGEVDRLGRLVGDLLTLARFETGAVTLERQPVSVREIFSDVVALMRTLAEDADVVLSEEVAPDDIRVDADRDRIVQVLVGFTDNALKHAPAGTSVTLRATIDGDGVRLSVTDEGPGLAPEHIERVFERFYRADSARRGTGTGLGLAIAKEIVEAHGSRIEVVSEAGRGTTFTFVLPRA